MGPIRNCGDVLCQTQGVPGEPSQAGRNVSLQPKDREIPVKEHCCPGEPFGPGSNCQLYFDHFFPHVEKKKKTT